MKKTVTKWMFKVLETINYWRSFPVLWFRLYVLPNPATRLYNNNSSLFIRYLYCMWQEDLVSRNDLIYFDANKGSSKVLGDSERVTRIQRLMSFYMRQNPWGPFIKPLYTKSINGEISIIQEAVGLMADGPTITYYHSPSSQETPSETQEYPTNTIYPPGTPHPSRKNKKTISNLQELQYTKSYGYRMQKRQEAAKSRTALEELINSIRRV